MASAKTKEKSPMQQFYCGKTVLVTGGTGFLGKALVEKLLRSCPEIRQLYLLVREKKGETGEDRLKKLFDDEIYRRLKASNPEFSERVAVVLGDLHSPRLGLDQSDEALLTQTVDIVIHSAATVRFDEPLKRAVAVNLVATKELCVLAQNMPNLKAFVYVSTAYCNCDREWVPEKVCPSLVCPEKLIALTDLLDETTLDNITPVLLGKKPNTYVYTKCAAEQVVDSFKSSLPAGIVRPCCVLASQSEPVAGWLESLQGPTAVTTGLLTGVMRHIPADGKVPLHAVPVDWTANCILALAFHLAQRDTLELPVINYVPTSTNSLTWSQWLVLLVTEARQNPSQDLLWYPFYTLSSRPWVNVILCTLLHHWPARAMETVTGATQLSKVAQRMDKYFSYTQFFSTTHFHFEERNALMLWESLEPLDQQLFPFNMADIHWQSYFSDYVRGCRQHLLAESPLTLPRARQRLNKLFMIHIATLALFFFIVVTFFIYLFAV